jgi:hypothetical protein
LFYFFGLGVKLAQVGVVKYAMLHDGLIIRARLHAKIKEQQVFNLSLLDIVLVNKTLISAGKQRLTRPNLDFLLEQEALDSFRFRNLTLAL